MERKKHIREAIIRKRDAMPEEERHEKSLRIAEKIKDIPVYQKAHVLLIYRNFRSEVETEVIFDDAWKRNKTVCAPRVEGNEIRFCQVRSREDFESGVWGIQEPKMSCPVFREAEKGVDIFAILPGTVFDKKGRRIGYGGGYYDRYLEGRENIHTAALGFDIQVLDKIPSGPFDVCPEMIVTESHIYMQRREEHV